MAKFNPDFWEVTISSASWGQFSVEDGLWHQSPEEVVWRHEHIERAKAMAQRVRDIVDQTLTPPAAGGHATLLLRGDEPTPDRRALGH